MIFQESLWNNLKKSRTGRLSGQERLIGIDLYHKRVQKRIDLAPFLLAAIQFYSLILSSSARFTPKLVNVTFNSIYLSCIEL